MHRQFKHYTHYLDNKRYIVMALLASDYVIAADSEDFLYNPCLKA